MRNRQVGGPAIILALLTMAAGTALPAESGLPANPAAAGVRGQTPDVSTPPTSTEQKQHQDAALDKVEGFFRDMGDDRAVKKLQELRQQNAVRFTPTPSSEENASYYKGAVSLPSSFVDRVKEPARNNPRQIEYDQAKQFEYVADMAQSLVHEFNHADHDRPEDRTLGVNVDKVTSAYQPGGSHFEAIAYEDALKRTEQWVTTMHERIATEEGCTRENARKLRTVCELWQVYNNEVMGKAGKTIPWKPDGDKSSYWTDASGNPVLMHEKRSEIQKIQDEATRTEAACEMLEALSAVLGVPVRKGASMEELLELLSQSVHSESAFRDLTNKLADAAGQRDDNPADKAQTLRERGYPLLEQQWKARRKKWEDVLSGVIRDLEAAPLTLAWEPQPAVLDAKTGKAVVTVTASDQKLTAARTKLNFLVRRLTGQEPQVRIIDYWTGPDEKNQPFEWPSGAVRRLELKQLGPQEVSLRRVILIDVNAAAGASAGTDSPVKKRIERAASAVIEIKGDFPAQITGRWTGPMVLGSIEWPGAQDGQQGCDLDKLKGKTFTLTFDVPNSARGNMPTRITPNDGAGEATEASFSFQNANGSFQAQGDINGGRLVFSGQYAKLAEVWTLRGAWSAAKEGIKMGGTWSAKNPQAR